METNTTPILQWNAPVQPIVERTQRWYVTGGIVVLAVAAYGILANSWPLAVVSVLCGAMYYLLRDHKPRETTCVIYENGAMYDGQFYRWDAFEGFWVLATPTHNELHLTYPSKRKNDLVIQITTLSVDETRILIGSFLKELTDRKETLIDIFTRIAKL